MEDNDEDVMKLVVLSVHYTVRFRQLKGNQSANIIVSLLPFSIQQMSIK